MGILDTLFAHRQRRRQDAFYAERLELLSSLSEEDLSALAALPKGKTRAALKTALFRASAVRAEAYTARQAEKAKCIARACFAFGINDAELLMNLGEYALRHRAEEGAAYYKTAFEERPLLLDLITLPAHLSRYLPLAEDPEGVLRRIWEAYRERGEVTVPRLGFLTYRLRHLPDLRVEDVDEAIGVARGLSSTGAAGTAAKSLESLLALRAELTEELSAEHSSAR